MFNIQRLITLLSGAGYRVAELSDVGSATRRGLLYEVIERDGDVAVMSLMVSIPEPESHPGVPASLYFASGRRPTDPNA